MTSVLSSPPTSQQAGPRVPRIGDWVQYLYTDRTPYYHNVRSKETTWMAPACWPADRDRPSEWAAIGCPEEPEWLLVRTLSGEIYFYHPKSELTSWTPTPAVQAYLLRLEEQETQTTPSSQPSTSTLNSGEETGDGTSNTPPLKRQKTCGDQIDEPAAQPDTDQPPSSMSVPPSFETISKEFFDMLREHKISPFSSWEKEQVKLVQDLRFQAVKQHKTRRELFDDFSKVRLQEQLAENQRALKSFKLFVSSRLDDPEIAKKYFPPSLDPPFNTAKNFEKFESEHINEPDLISAKENPDLPSTKRKQVFDAVLIPLIQIARQQKSLSKKQDEESFLSLLRDNTPKYISPRTSWRSVKDRLRDDDRFDSIDSHTREVLFEQFTKQLEAQEKKKEGPERDFSKHETERRRSALQFSEDKEDFRCLLTEFIRSPSHSDGSELRWSNALEILEPKSRYKSCTLSPFQMEELFDEHMENLQNRKLRDLTQMFKDKMDHLRLDSKFEDAIQIINQTDPRYSTLSESQRCTAFTWFLEELEHSAAASFEEMLKVDLRRITPANSGPSFEAALVELSRDSRWRALDANPHVREALIERVRHPESRRSMPFWTK